MQFGVDIHGAQRVNPKDFDSGWLYLSLSSPRWPMMDNKKNMADETASYGGGMSMSEKDAAGGRFVEGSSTDRSS
ncbi:hypothetical protein EYF80_000899 [Liparis tanakae]|uniref:Uncharacterized protein n=1 Tax=Liparis tanakae TaxID=230148 RepID=A0A4Z2JGC7_9TELE|nr:hypothetical protein EYF80_000899 [Liparis tanakae]